MFVMPVLLAVLSWSRWGRKNNNNLPSRIGNRCSARTTCKARLNSRKAAKNKLSGIDPKILALPTNNIVKKVNRQNEILR